VSRPVNLADTLARLEPLGTPGGGDAGGERPAAQVRL
jgi:hypothetical protein